MVFGMNNDQVIWLTIIVIGFVIGFLIGAFSCMIITAKENKGLKKEIDKFRDLSFEDMDRWKMKYDKDDYEAY